MLARYMYAKELQRKIRVGRLPAGFELRDGVLYVNEKKVVPIEEKEKVIKQYLNDPATQGGRDRLYGHLRRDVVGVSRRDVAKVLARDEAHQLHAPLKAPVVSRPIVPTDKAKIAQIDLVDVQKWSTPANGNVRYLLTYIDLFSKWAAVRPLTNKAQPTVVRALADILDSLPVSWRPKTVQADNGSEFQQQMQTMLQRRGIKFIHSQAYNPTAQGHIERFNRTLKSAISEYMTRHKTKKYTDVLQKFVDNFNHTIHQSTKMIPQHVMESKLDDLDKLGIRQEIMQKNSLRQSDLHDNLSVGDLVRVAITTDSKIRRNKFRKRTDANWSRTIYEIATVVQPDTAGARPQYTLKNRQTGRTWSKRYFAWQLKRIDLPDAEPIDERVGESDAGVDERAAVNQQPANNEPEVKQRPKRSWKPTLAALQRFQFD